VGDALRALEPRRFAERSGFDQAAVSGKLHAEKRQLIFALAHFIDG